MHDVCISGTQVQCLNHGPSFCKTQQLGNGMEADPVLSVMYVLFSKHIPSVQDPSEELSMQKMKHGSGKWGMPGGSQNSKMLTH